MTTQAEKACLCVCSFACNGHENGGFLGKFDSANFEFFDGSHVYLDCWPTKIAQEQKGIRIGRVVLPFAKWKEWHGNWCWDAYWMLPSKASRALRYLIQQRGASKTEISEGLATGVWNAWCKPETHVSFKESSHAHIR